MVARAAALALAAAAAAAAACTPVRNTSGFIADVPNPASSVQAGVDTKATVVARLGSPSTTSVFEGETWYYIRSVQESFAFFEPKTVEREVIVVRFAESDVVSAVDVFGVEKGQVVAYAAAETPTRGRELGIIEQLFGNVGRTPLPETEEPGERRRP